MKVFLSLALVGIASLWTPPAVRADPLPTRYRVIDLGTLGGDGSSANALNSEGEIVGTAKLKNGDEHAFLFQSGRMHDLGVISGQRSDAFAINDLHEIVGDS